MFLIKGNMFILQGDQSLNGNSDVDLKPNVENSVVENNVHLSSLLASTSTGSKNLDPTSTTSTSLLQAIADSSSTTTTTTPITPVTPTSTAVKMEVDPSAIKEEIKTEVKQEPVEEDSSSSQVKEEAAENSTSPKTEAMDESSQNSNLDVKPASVESSSFQASKPCNKKGKLCGSTL